MKAQTTFNINYTSGIKSGAYACKVLDANTHLVSSYFNDSSNGQQGLDVKKINNQGAVIKRKRFLFQSFDYLSYLNNVFQTDISNSTLLLSGASYSGNPSVVIMSSVNKSTLDTNWTKYYYDGVYNYNLNTVFKTKANEFWYFGNKFNNLGYSERPCAIKVDSSGNILSVKTFTNLIKYDVRVAYYDAINNLIYFGGKNNNPSTSIECIVCMDTLGNVVWNQQNYGQITFSQIEKKNNYLVIVGSVYAGDFAPPSTINPTYKLNILKINASNGAIIWQKPYGHRRLTNYLTSVVISSDESIVSAGCYYYATSMYNIISDGIVLKVNSIGDSLWSQTYSNFNLNVQEAFYDIKGTQDGGYIMCGVPFYATDPTSQSWVVKTDSLGNAPGRTTYISEQEKKGILSIYPNPTKNKLFVSLKQSNYNNAYELSIYNTLGQIVLNFPSESYEQKMAIDIGNLKAGTYILQLKSNTEIYTQKVLLE